MELNKKFIARMTRMYGVIVLISSVSRYGPQLISIPVLDEYNNQKWEAFLENNHLAPVEIPSVLLFLKKSLCGIPLVRL